MVHEEETEEVEASPQAEGVSGNTNLSVTSGNLHSNMEKNLKAFFIESLRSSKRKHTSIYYNRYLHAILKLLGASIYMSVNSLLYTVFVLY